MYAQIVANAISITAAARYDGQLVLETTCRDYEHYCSLPAVVRFEGVECVLTGWNSDRQYACYKQGGMVAHRVNKLR